ncbi:MAG TPA: YfhD family protein [Bacillales bacterium]
MAKNKNKKEKSVARAEDVEFSREMADEDDREARERAERADKRSKS